MLGRKSVIALGIACLATVSHAQTEPATDAAQALAAPAGSGCELHVYPTRNFIAMNTGLLSGLGPLGAVADMAAHKDKVKTVKELMAEYLTPEAQLTVLNKVGLAASLNLPADTQIIVEKSFPTADELKLDATLKAKLDEVAAAEKAGKRLTSSAATCYAELSVSYVFYQKAAMYGTRVFTFFWLRDFRSGGKAPLVSKGQVQNSASAFPAATLDQEEIAKAALLEAYGQNLTKWAKLKLRKS